MPVGYGINKLRINCVVENDKVGMDFLEEEITSFEELVCTVIYNTHVVCFKNFLYSKHVMFTKISIIVIDIITMGLI